MYTIASRPSALSQALHLMTTLLQPLTRLLRDAQQTFNARWEGRARAAVTVRELSLLSDRDLRDIGINRGDIARLAQEERHWRQI